MKLLLIAFVLFVATGHAQVNENCTTVNCTNGAECVQLDWGVGHGVDCGWGGNRYGSEGNSCFFDEKGTWSAVDTWVGTKTRDFIVTMILLLLCWSILFIILFAICRLAFKPYKANSIEKANQLIVSSVSGVSDTDKFVKVARAYNVNPIIVDFNTSTMVMVFLGFILFMIGASTPATFHSGTAIWPSGPLTDAMSCATYSGFLFSGLMFMSCGSLYHTLSVLEVFNENDAISKEEGPLAAVLNKLHLMNGGVSMKKGLLMVILFTSIPIRVVLIYGQSSIQARSCCERLVTASSNDFAFNIIPDIIFFLDTIACLYLGYLIWVNRNVSTIIDSLNEQTFGTFNIWFTWWGVFLMAVFKFLMAAYAAVLLALDLAAYMASHNTGKFEPLLKGWVAMIITMSLFVLTRLYFYWNQLSMLANQDAQVQAADQEELTTGLDAVKKSIPASDAKAAHRARARCNYAAVIHGQHHMYQPCGTNSLYYPTRHIVLVNAERPKYESL